MLGLVDDRSYANAFTRFADHSTSHETACSAKLIAEISITSALVIEYLSFDFFDMPYIMSIWILAVV